MALQGTIDAFPLTDVLQLLSSSHKTGRLLLDGDRGERTLWIADGEVVGGGEGSAATVDAAVLVFEMMRFREASFVFDAIEPDGNVVVDVEPMSLETCVARAAELLEEWAEIEEVVPSMRHRVRIVEELAEASVTLDRVSWGLIARLGDEPAVMDLAERLHRDELGCCAAVAGLVERGLVEVTGPAEGATAVDDGTAPSIADLRETMTFDESGDDPDDPDDPDDTVVEFPERFPIDDLVGPDPADADDPWSSPEMEQLEAQRFAAAQTFDSVGLEPVPMVESADVWDEMVAAQAEESDETADEVLRQMSRLSPKAAEAIAAALNTPGESAGRSDNGRDQPDGDGPVPYMGSF